MTAAYHGLGARKKHSEIVGDKVQISQAIACGESGSETTV